VPPRLLGLVPRYLEICLGHSRSIRSHLQFGQFDEIVHIAWFLQGSGHSFGLRAVSEVGMMISLAAHSQDIGRIEILNDYLKKYVSSVEIARAQG